MAFLPARLDSRDNKAHAHPKPVCDTERVCRIDHGGKCGCLQETGKKHYPKCSIKYCSPESSVFFKDLQVHPRTRKRNKPANGQQDSFRRRQVHKKAMAGLQKRLLIITRIQR